MKNIASSRKEIFLVIIIAVVMTVLTSSKYFSQLVYAPKDHVFVGLTHYFEDYFYYLDQFYQGAHGGWLTYNNFTSEPLKPTLIYFSHILLGKVGGLFGLESFVSYNLSLIILKFAFFMTSFYVLRRIFPNNFKYQLITFLIFIFSTSFPDNNLNASGEIVQIPRRIWGTKNLISSRFGNIPYRYILNLLFLAEFMMIGRITQKISELLSQRKKIEIKSILTETGKYIFWATVIMFCLTLTDGAIALMLVLALFISLFLCTYNLDLKIRMKAIIPLLLFILVPFVLAGFYLNQTINIDPVYKQGVNWDIEEYYKQINILDISEFIFSFGLFGIIFVIGIPSYLKQKKNIINYTAGIISLLCIAGYIFPYLFSIKFPGNRFLFGSFYLFASIVAFHGLLTIETILKKKILYLLIILYILVNLYTFRLSLISDIKPLQEPEYHFAYIPEDLYRGLTFLRNNVPKQSIVLANPTSSMDLLIPGVTGMKTYTGHFLTTLNSDEKDLNAHNLLFDRKNIANPKEFLQKNNIRYIMFTKYDGFVGKKDVHVKDLTADLPSLKVIFNNDMITILKVEDE